MVTLSIVLFVALITPVYIALAAIGRALKKAGLAR